jgi:hypothetical protein
MTSNLCLAHTLILKYLNIKIYQKYMKNLKDFKNQFGAAKPNNNKEKLSLWQRFICCLDAVGFALAFCFTSFLASFTGSLNRAYAYLYRLPRWAGIMVLIVATAFIVFFSMLAFVLVFGSIHSVLHELFKGGLLKFTGIMLGHWIGVFRHCWFIASAAYGPTSLVHMYCASLYIYALKSKVLVCFNLVLIFYFSIVFYYFALMLVSLLRNIKHLDLRPKPIVFLIGLVVAVCLMLFAWFPPVFGFGLDTIFENPRDPFAPFRDGCPSCGQSSSIGIGFMGSLFMYCYAYLFKPFFYILAGYSYSAFKQTKATTQRIHNISHTNLFGVFFAVICVVFVILIAYSFIPVHPHWEEMIWGDMLIS